MKRGPYTPEEDAALRELCARGFQNKQIAIELDRTVDSVEDRRYVLKIPSTYYWTGDEKLLLEAMWLAGKPVKEIEERLNRSRRSIYGMRVTMGLPPRPHPPLFGPWSRTPKRVKELEPAA